MVETYSPTKWGEYLAVVKRSEVMRRETFGLGQSNSHSEDDLNTRNAIQAQCIADMKIAHCFAEQGISS